MWNHFIWMFDLLAIICRKIKCHLFNPQPAFWGTTFSVGVSNFLIWMSKRNINWTFHVQSATLLLLLQVAPLLLLLLFWQYPFLTNEEENKNDLSSKPGLLVDIPWPMSKGCNEDFVMSTLLHASLNTNSVVMRSLF